MLDLHAETQAAFHGKELTGRIRLGVPDDYAAKYLTPALKRFAPNFGSVEIELSCEQSTSLIPRVESGDLDLALVSREQPNQARYCFMNRWCGWVLHSLRSGGAIHYPLRFMKVQALLNVVLSTH